MERVKLNQILCGCRFAAALGFTHPGSSCVWPLTSWNQPVGALQAGGYTAYRNGTGVLVDVSPGEKAKPINLLNDADIAVMDFEVQ